jgi:capsular polysaccharide biosynthesis protein
VRRDVFARVLFGNREAIAIALILGALVGLIYSLLQPPSYSATARVMVIVERGGGMYDELATAYLTQKRVENYRTLLTSTSLLDRAIQAHGLPVSSRDLADNLTLGSPKDTSLIEITVAAPSPTLAADFASAIGQEFVAASAQLEGRAPIHSRLVGYAERPTSQENPRTTKNIVDAALAGAVLAIAFLIYRARTNPRLSYLTELSTIDGVPVLGHLAIDRQTYLSGQRSAVRQAAATKYIADELAERLMSMDPQDQQFQVICQDRRLGDLVADMLRRSLADRAPALATGRSVIPSVVSEGAEANVRVGVISAGSRWEDAKRFAEDIQKHGNRHALVVVTQA